MWPTPPLLPADARARAGARLIAREVDEVLRPPADRYLRQTLMRPQGDGDPETIATAREELRAELARLEQALDGDWVAGAFSLADLTLYPTVRLLRRVGERAPPFTLDALIGPRLRAWMGRIEALPYYQRTIPPHWKG